MPETLHLPHVLAAVLEADHLIESVRTEEIEDPQLRLEVRGYLHALSVLAAQVEKELG